MKFPGMDERQWWIAMVIFGSAFLGAAMVAKERDLATIALGIVTFGFGEWRNHPLQTRLGHGFKITGYPRSASLFGTALDAIGIGLIIWGGYKFFSTS